MRGFRIKKETGKKLKILKRNLRELGIKLESSEQVARDLGAEITRLKEIRSEYDNVEGNSKHEGITIPSIGATVDLKKTSGVYVVQYRHGAHVKLAKFKELIQGNEQPRKIDFDLPHDKMINSDGDEVTFNKGDLLSVTYLPDLGKEQIGFHFVNVSPADEKGKLQYALALHMIGMGDKPGADPQTYLVVDGAFRKVH